MSEQPFVRTKPHDRFLAWINLTVGTLGNIPTVRIRNRVGSPYWMHINSVEVTSNVSKDLRLEIGPSTTDLTDAVSMLYELDAKAWYGIGPAIFSNRWQLTSQATTGSFGDPFLNAFVGADRPNPIPIDLYLRPGHAFQLLFAVTETSAVGDIFWPIVRWEDVPIHEVPR